MNPMPANGRREPFHKAQSLSYMKLLDDAIRRTVYKQIGQGASPPGCQAYSKQDRHKDEANRQSQELTLALRSFTLLIKSRDRSSVSGPYSKLEPATFRSALQSSKTAIPGRAVHGSRKPVMSSFERACEGACDAGNRNTAAARCTPCVRSDRARRLGLWPRTSGEAARPA